MMLAKTSHTIELDPEIINTIIGYNDNVKKETKQQHSMRILEARRAIEKHNEQKQLSDTLNDDWFVD
jgi:hypothetical protein